MTTCGEGTPGELRIQWAKALGGSTPPSRTRVKSRASAETLGAGSSPGPSFVPLLSSQTVGGFVAPAPAVIMPWRLREMAHELIEMKWSGSLTAFPGAASVHLDDKIFACRDVFRHHCVA
jgi:hypothetical protein